ncbi:hypothetical protein [Psychroserpens sp.]|uniref:hypothetical protein n=1 Tax=Psychroserpens sp. TaxID=2020870 RepID=UPI001B13E426|nr:hypothetical protein [Psychroserpens sp.]MBO6606183.1 hypothetical protein [Psychroserpens sp.]MBO6631953.1 hypothetical protein [Psychroserpens sp.]MBO6652445.1 hypothetical protein [Psychroserpens sp.]MBO6681783.1 hypothetical protein [Psychroserpens sp.]MBO6749558.1 hypothetical protein [Psychroserpens sp.]
MKTVIKISKVVNIIALLFLLLGLYGLPMTGLLQVIAAILIFAARPKEKLLWVYFGTVLAFFCIWDYKIIQWQWLYIIPPSLIILLTYVIHFKKFK